jgi:putative ATP-binding cassette transporter
MRSFGQIALIRDQSQLLGRFWQAASQCWLERKARAAGLGTLLVTIVLLQLLVQFLLNVWNRNFFNALERRDGHVLWLQAQLFVPLAAASIFLAAASVWGRMTAQRTWREAMTRHIVGIWLENDRFRHLNLKGSENPEYRIAVDARIATDAPVDLALALFSSIVTSITFFSVLWTVGGSIDVPLFGVAVTIPGYLVFAVIIYSGVVTTLMILFGHHLTAVSERTNQTEAEFRASVDALRDESGRPEGVADGTDKRELLLLKLQAVLLWWREYCWQLVRTTLVSHANFLFATVVGLILCAPKYLSGAMSLGELTQSAAAFVVVQGAFNWLVDNYARLSDWRSSAYRVATLLRALDELKGQVESPPSRDDAKSPAPVPAHKDV